MVVALRLARDGRYLVSPFPLGPVSWHASKLDLTPRARVLDDRFNLKSTIVASQLPLSHWHEYLGEATLADAILDRLVHNAYKIQLKGESMRKKKSPLTTKPT